MDQAVGAPGLGKVAVGAPGLGKAAAGRIDAARVRAVLFDLDDTLINWRAAEHAAMGALVQDRFVPLGCAEAQVREVYAGVMEENFRAFRATGTWWYVGDRLRLLVDRLGVAASLPPEALADEFRLRVAERLEFLEGAVEAMAAARGGGRRVGLLTNGPSAVQRPKVEAFGIERHVHFVGISGELGAWKPAPEAFLRALAPLGVPPEAALMVGDSIDFDIGPAKAMGMQTCWVNPDVLASPHADLVVPHPGALVPHLPDLPAP